MVGIETAREAIHLTCQVLWDVLSPLYMKPPSESEWKEIADGFWQRWQFPACVGAVDGKHIEVECPKNSGSLFFNYKKTFSVVLMAVVDSKYKFVLIDVGASGRLSDGGVFKNSVIGQRLESGMLNLPGPTTFPGTSTCTQHVFVGDEAFQLRTDFMRPFPGRLTDDEKIVFNYRLSRARRCVENAFGILVSRWRLFRSPVKLDLENVDNVVKAACVLHNFLCTNLGRIPRYCPPGLVDREDSTGNLREGSWRKTMRRCSNIYDMESSHARNSSKAAVALRNGTAAFFMTRGGSVQWQWKRPGVRGVLLGSSA